MTLTSALTRHLKCPELFRNLANEPHPSVAGQRQRFSVFNPSTGELLAEVPDMGAADAHAAIERADAAQEPWSGLTARARSDILWKWHRSFLNTAMTSQPS